MTNILTFLLFNIFDVLHITFDNLFCEFNLACLKKINNSFFGNHFNHEHNITYL